MKTTVTTPLAMQLKNKFLQKMCYLLLLFSGMAFAQPAINNPTPYEVCDDNNDGSAYFDLHSIKDPEIINGIPNLVVSYHLSNIDSQTNTNPISSPNIFFTQTIFIRVIDSADPNNPSFTTLSLIVHELPIANQAPNLIQTNSIPTAVFDLTSYNNIYYGGPGAIVNFYQSLAEAQSGTNAIFNASSYTNISNPQLIWVRVTNAVTGCFIITSYYLFVNPFQINQPTPYLVCDDNNDGISCEFILSTKDSEISTQPGIQIAYHLTPTDAQTGANPIPANTPFCNYINPQMIYARVWDPALSGAFSITSFNLVVNTKPNFTIENTNICNGALATITAVNQGNTGNFSYVWTTPPGILIPGNVPSFTTSSIGTYSLLITDLTTTCTKSLSTTVSSLPNTSPTFSIPTTLCSGSITALPTTSDNGITGYWSPALTVGTNDYTFTPYVGQCSSGYMTSITVIVPPTANQAPNLMIVDSPTYDGFAIFNLTTQNSVINTSAGLVFEYFPSSIDAQNNTNLIANPSAFTNITNPQTIGVRVINTVTGCYSITSFQLIVTDPNIVYIPDANFKAKLITLGVDTNNDYEIQYSEALITSNLNVSYSGINDLTGIEAFTNLQYLDCHNNFILSLDVTALNSLINFDCSYNYNLSGLSLSNNLNLTVLNVSHCNLTILNLFLLNNLINCDISYNHLTSLDISQLTNLTLFNCESNDLSSLNVLYNTNLTSLVCNTNNLTNLELSNNNSIETLACGYNNLTTLSITNLVNLARIYCENNSLSSLILPNSMFLTNIWCQNNHITSLYLSTTTHLIECLAFNNSLSELFIKNGVDYILHNYFPNPTGYYCYNFTDNINLNFVCSDDNKVTSLMNYFNLNSISNVQVNSYCSFTPGGNHNTISGAIKFDANNNGCDASDLPQPNIRIDINDGTTQGATFTNNTGNYNFYTPAGSFDLTPDIENPTWFTFSPTTATIPFADANNNSNTQDFCLSANGTHTDVEVVIEPITPARPGFDAVYKIVYKNKGNQMVSANVSFNYNDAVLDFISATVPPSFQTIGVLNFGFSNLLPFENRSFYITLHVNAPTDTPPVNIGDVLNFTAALLNIGDENPSDNTFIYNQIVVGSYDPNNITCLEGASVPTSQIGSFLHYGVNFENTGNYPAENIVVKTIIDTTKYDINSLQMLNTSNPAYTRITGNVVEFIFNNIELDSGGHGNVLFKIKTLNSLVNGDMVSREADIFFDYNAPVATGMANTTFQTLNNGQFVLDNSIAVAPNPTSSIVNINGSSAIKSVQVYDIQGRLLETKLLEDVNTTINLSDKTNGIYFLKITTENGSKVEKIIKE